MPFIVVGRPMSDLCWQCQQNSNLIMKAVNRSAREKTMVSYFVCMLLLTNRTNTVSRHTYFILEL